MNRVDASPLWVLCGAVHVLAARVELGAEASQDDFDLLVRLLEVAQDKVLNPEGGGT